MKKSTLFLIILVAIFFTSTLVLIKLNYLKPQSTTISTASITPTVTRDSTADWKIYENKDFGISFLYPENYFFEKMPDNEYSGIYFWKNGSDTKSYYEYIPMLGGEKPKDFPLFVMQRYNEEIRTLLTAPENQSGPIEMSFVKDIDNINTLFKVYLFGVSDIGQYCALETPFKKTITITCSDDQLKNPIFNQILSTFKFTNTISDPTLGWKKFGSMSYDISFKYPQDWSVETENMTIFLKSPKTIAALSNKNNTWTRVGDLIISSLTQKSLPNNQNNLPLSSWITSNYSANPIHNITLAGMKGFKVTSCGDSCLEEIYLEDENVIYKIDSGNSDHFTTELNQILSTLTSSNSPSLVQPSQQSPVAGICQEVSKNQEVTIIISPDNVPVPRCVEVTSGQKLKITNNSPNSIEIYQTKPKTIIKPGVSFVFPQAVGAFLEPGIHSIAGAEIWLQ